MAVATATVAEAAGMVTGALRGAASPPAGSRRRHAGQADELWADGVLELLEGQRRGLAARGLEAFEASVKEDGSDADRLCFVGTLRMMHGRLAQAAESFEAAIAAAPGERHAYLELMLMLEGQGRHEEARSVASRAIAAGANWADPWQRPPLFVPGLRSRPFWDRSEFTWAGDLEAAASGIKAELQELLDLGAKGGWNKVGDARAAQDGSIVAPGGEWRELVVFGAQGEDNVPEAARAQDALPRTRALLEELLPSAVAMAKIGAGEIIFSALYPGTRLVPHCASSNNRLTCHLGLLCPSGPRIRVGEAWASWEEGKCMFFDDSFEHEVLHEGDDVRVVLLIRFWHPDLPPERYMPMLSEGMEQFNDMQRRRSVPPLSPSVSDLLVARRAAPGAAAPAARPAAGGAELQEALDAAVAGDEDLE